MRKVKASSSIPSSSTTQFHPSSLAREPGTGVVFKSLLRTPTNARLVPRCRPRLASPSVVGGAIIKAEIVFPSSVNFASPFLSAKLNCDSTAFWKVDNMEGSRGVRLSVQPLPRVSLWRPSSLQPFLELQNWSQPANWRFEEKPAKWFLLLVVHHWRRNSLSGLHLQSFTVACF